MNKIIFGDCRTVIKNLIKQDIKVQTCVTSPPYFGLRNYGVNGQLGLENTIDEYVQNMVEVFRLVRELLHDDGTLWLNLGDSYAGSGRGQYSSGTNDPKQPKSKGQILPPNKATLSNLKPKDLIGIPWRVAFALQADGWFLRQDIIWHKPNALPESVRDRCTKAHEYIFLFSKSRKYYYDFESIKEPANLTSKGNAKTFRGGAYIENSTFENSIGGKRTAIGNTRSSRNSFKRENSKRSQPLANQIYGTHRNNRLESKWDIFTRNKRSVWTVATRGYKGAHFATFPAELIEPCVLAGARINDVVFDPFMGSGTTAEVALKHHRQYLGCELNQDYEVLQNQRLEKMIRGTSS